MSTADKNRNLLSLRLIPFQMIGKSKRNLDKVLKLIEFWIYLQSFSVDMEKSFE